MRLGVSTKFIHSSPEEWAKKMTELGCRAVVFPVDYTVPENLIADYVLEAKKNDLLIAEVGIWRNVFSPNQQERMDARKYAIGQLRLADEIGATCCVNISGTSGGTIWDGGYSENFTKAQWDNIVEYTRNLIDEVKPTRTKYSIEPMPWMYPTGPDEYLKLMCDIDRESLGIHLDFINMIHSPQRFFFMDDFMEECFEKLGEKILSCHLKDIRLKQELTFQLQETCCGKGSLNIEKYVTLIDRYNKDMPVIIEHLNTDKEYLSSLRYVVERLSKAGISSYYGRM